MTTLRRCRSPLACRHLASSRGCSPRRHGSDKTSERAERGSRLGPVRLCAGRRLATAPVWRRARPMQLRGGRGRACGETGLALSGERRCDGG
eukprot:2759066-Prymnesium_polylepis.1